MVPYNDNMDTTLALKIGRYKTFQKDCRDTGRKAEYCPVYVGRGKFVAHNVRRLLLSVDLTDCKTNTILSGLHSTVEKNIQWIRFKTIEEYWATANNQLI